MNKIFIISDNREESGRISSSLKKSITDCAVTVIGSETVNSKTIKNESPDLLLINAHWSEKHIRKICKKLSLSDKPGHTPAIILIHEINDLNGRFEVSGIDSYVFLTNVVEESHLIAQIKVMLRLKKVESELMETRAELHQSQKMEAVGRFAGGIAHDFNNLLTVILGSSDILLTNSKLDEKHLYYIKEIKKSAERASSLTQQLLTFSSKQVLQPKLINLNKLIIKIKEMFPEIAGEKVAFQTNLESELGLIQADPGQIEQVLMTLLVNTADELKKGGSLEISTRNVYIDEGNSGKNTGLQIGYYIQLTANTTGQEIEDIEKSDSDPFVTKSELLKEMGPGFATVYGIIRQSGGYIKVYKDRDQRFTYIIFFPRIDEFFDKQKETIEDIKPVHGNETILLVEDEDVVRNMVYTILNSFGYSVLEAKNGEEALFISEHKKEKTINLLITDVVMPGMSCRNLAEKLMTKSPGMKILYISGYTDDAIIYQGIMGEGAPFLQKPFSPNVLANKVREVLDTK